MSTPTADRTDRLWQLLPNWVKEQDLEQAGQLRALLAVIARRVNEAEDDIWQFYDDLFVETASDWVVPYLAALVANDVLYDADRHGAARTATSLFPDLAPHDLRAQIAARVRADVGRTIYYRGRKGVPSMLEELARSVMGWPAHLVECFELLDWPQFLEHLRPQAALLDVRSPERCERAQGPFADAVRTVDVRLPRIGSTRGPVVGAGAIAAAQPGAVAASAFRPFATDPVEPSFNVHNVAVYAWRHQANPLVWVPARQSTSVPFGWTFSPLGNPAPLYSRWRREGDEFGMATESMVPQPIRRTFFAKDLRDYASTAPLRPAHTLLYGLFEDVAGAGIDAAPDASLVVFRNGVAVPPAVNPTAQPSSFVPRVRCMRLDPWPATQPPAMVVGVDVVAGRLVVGAGFADPTDEIRVSFHQGQAAALGGGGYPRPAWLIPREPELLGTAQPVERRVVRRRPLPVGAALPPSSSQHSDLIAAITAWIGGGQKPCVITILDSDTYQLPAAVTLPNDGWLVIEAADQERPLLQTPDPGLGIDVTVPPGERDRQAVLTLSGVVVEGHVRVVGELARLRIWHATLVPGRRLHEADGAPATRQPSIVTDAAPGVDFTQFRVELAFAISGPIRMPAVASGLWLLDSIVDGLDHRPNGAHVPLAGPAIVGAGGDVSDRGAPAHLERTTVLGVVTVESLDCSESIVTGRVDVLRTQQGCVRFSWLPIDSVTPHRHRCQPELTAGAAAGAAVARALESNPALTAAQQANVRAAAFDAVASALVPSFAARHYGHPAYGQLAEGCPAEVANGAADGSEMGAMNHLKQAQRESNLRLRLAEYLPFGLDPALVYVT
jgi:hypothetical protein